MLSTMQEYSFEVVTQNSEAKMYKFFVSKTKGGLKMKEGKDRVGENFPGHQIKFKYKFSEVDKKALSLASCIFLISRIFFILERSIKFFWLFNHSESCFTNIRGSRGKNASPPPVVEMSLHE